MGKEMETTAKINMDISGLKKGIQDAQRQIRLANSEFKAASSGMKDWETSSDGLTKKLEQLGTKLTAQGAILSDLQAQYEAVCAEQGETSAAAENLKVKINNQQAAINKTEAEMAKYKDALNDVQEAEEKAVTNSKLKELGKGVDEANQKIKLATAEFETAASSMKDWEKTTDGVNAKIRQLQTVMSAQQDVLGGLKEQYALVAESQGENSQEAQELAIKILNQEAAINKTEKSLKEYGQHLQTIEGEQKKAESAFGLLNSAISEQQAELDDLKTRYANVVLEQGKHSKEAKNLAKEISGLSGELKENKSQMENAQGAADDLDKTTEKTGKSAMGAAEGFTVLKGALAYLAAEAVKVTVESLKKLGAAAVDVGKQAVANYASYEQLVGGVETLFGAGGQSVEEYAKSIGKSVSEAQGEFDSLLKAQETVVKNANDAYKTAGLSANEYMETVTSFSASLISSLGGDTEKAAGYADQAIIDMSDNANKMGTSMQDIQNAYQGFAKQNYTMLDNLKLGYGGTKEEMQRLLKDAEELTGKKFDVSNFADITEAIHAIQTEMGITGTTAKEAATTIEGSTNSMKAAWQNLLTGLAAGDEMDLSQLIHNFVDSLATLGDNLIPRIKITIDSMAKAIPKLVAQLFPQIADVIHSNLPTVIDGGVQVVLSLLTGIIQAMPEMTAAIGQVITSLLSTLESAVPQVVTLIINTIPQIVTTLMQALPQIIQACFQFASAIVAALPDIISTIMKALPQIIQEIVDGLVSGADMVVEGAVLLFTAIVKAIPQIVSLLSKELPSIIDTIINAVVKALPELLNASVKLLEEIVNAIPKIIPQLVKALPQIITSIISVLTKNIPLILKTAITLFNALVEALPTIIQALTKELPGVVNTIVTVLTDNLPVVLQAAITLLMEIVKAIPDIIKALVQSLPQIITAITEGLSAGVSSVAEVGRNLIKGLWNGISDMAAWIKSKIQGFGKGVLDSLKSFFGIHSPSKVMRDEVGKNIALGVIAGVDAEKKNAEKSAKELSELYVSSAKSRASELKKANKMTAAQEVTFWKTIMNQCKKGTKAYNTAAAQMAAAKSSLKKDVSSVTKTYVKDVAKVQSNLEKDITKLEKDLATKTTKYVEDVKKVNTELENNITKLENTYQESLISKRDSIVKSLNLFSAVKLDEAVDADVLTEDLKQQIEMMDEWDKVLQSLNKRLGSDSGLYAELKDMGVSSLETLKNINAMSDEELKAYAALYDKKQEIAMRRSMEENAALKTQTEEQIRQLKEEAQKQLDELDSEYETAKAETAAQIAEVKAEAEKQLTSLKKTYKAGLKALGVTTKKQSGAIGKAIVDGINSGIKNGAKGLSSTLKEFAKSMVDQIKKDLKIKSPSRVMRDQVGKYISLGIAQGITQNEAAIKKALSGLTRDAQSSFDLGISQAKKRMVSGTGYSSSGTQGMHQSSTSSYTFNQYNTSPKALSRLEIYRQTNNILSFAKGV